jgi:hypothetical protein
MRIRHLGSGGGDIEYIYDGDSILDELQNNTATLVAITVTVIVCSASWHSWCK